MSASEVSAQREFIWWSGKHAFDHSGRTWGVRWSTLPLARGVDMDFAVRAGHLARGAFAVQSP